MINALYARAIVVVCSTCNLPLSLRIAVCKGIASNKSYFSEIEITNLEFYLGLGPDLGRLLRYTSCSNPVLFTHLLQTGQPHDLAREIVSLDSDLFAAAVYLGNVPRDLVLQEALVQRQLGVVVWLHSNRYLTNIHDYVEAVCQRGLAFDHQQEQLWRASHIGHASRSLHSKSLEQATDWIEAFKRYDLLLPVWQWYSVVLRKPHCCHRQVLSLVRCALRHQQFDMLNEFFKTVVPSMTNLIVTDRETLLWIKMHPLLQDRVHTASNCPCEPEKLAYVKQALINVLHSDLELAEWMLAQGFCASKDALIDANVHILELLHQSRQLQNVDLLMAALELGAAGVEWIGQKKLLDKTETHLPLVDVLRALGRAKRGKWQLRLGVRQRHLLQALQRLVDLGYVLNQTEIPAVLGVNQSALLEIAKHAVIA